VKNWSESERHIPRHALLRTYNGAGLLAFLVGILIGWPLVTLLPAEHSVRTENQTFPQNSKTITFTKDVAPIIFHHCASCHHAASSASAPADTQMHLMSMHMSNMAHSASFSLLTYEDVKRMAFLIRTVTQNRSMPPWKPLPGYGQFQGKRRLTNAEIAMISKWVNEGAPEGNPKDLLPVPHFSAWHLGHPDLIVQMRKPYKVPAKGPEFIRCFVLPAHFPNDKYMTAFEVKPSNPEAVHHAIFVEDLYGAGRRLEKSPGSGYPCSGGFGFMAPGYLGFWTHGLFPRYEPPGVAKVLKKGADFVIQVHFHPLGKPVEEQIGIGLYLIKTPPEKIPTEITVSNYNLDIPPGDKDYQLKGFSFLPQDVELLSIFPHAHRLAKEIKASATLPGGSVKPLLWINDWNPMWQEQYWYARPIKLPQGSQINMEIDYDNSESNVRNPNHPPKRITWGEHSMDEMGEIHLQVVPVKKAADSSRKDIFPYSDTRETPAPQRAASAEERAQAEAHYSRALSFEQRGQLQRAIGELEDARSLNPGSAMVRNALGLALAHEGCLINSLEELRRAAQLRENWAEAHKNLGMVLEKIADIHNAIREYRIAVKLSPNDLSARNALALALMRNSQWDDAIEQFLTITSLAPDAAETYFNLAIGRLRKGEPGEATAVLHKVLTLKPVFPEAHVALGATFFREGEDKSAESECRTAIRQRPDYAAAYNMLGTILYQERDLDGALRAFEKGLRLDPKDWQAYLQRAEILKESKDTEGAVEYFRKGQEIRDRERVVQVAVVATEAGSRLLREGNPKEAIKKFAFALKLIPNFALAHYQLALSLSAEGRFPEANGEFALARKLDPTLKSPEACESKQMEQGPIIGSPTTEKGH
jgi:tetratricopeptide (TPR) repeat protein